MARNYVEKVAICDEGDSCMGTAHCACSHCHTESAFGHFPIAGLSCSFPVTPGSKDRHFDPDRRPQMVVFPEVHRCKSFPCHICNPTSRRIRIHPTDQCKTTEHFRLVDHERMDHVGLVPSGTRYGDGGHTCQKFPCPVCHPGRAHCSPVL